VIGVDFKYGTSKFLKDKNLFIVGYYVKSFSSDIGNDSAYGISIDFPNDTVDNYFSFFTIRENFYPALGFVRRRGIKNYHFDLSYNSRINGKLIRQFFFEFRGGVTTNLEGKTIAWHLFTAPLNVKLQSGEYIEFNYVPDYDFLDFPFEIHEGIIIPPGDYTMNRFRFELNTSKKRPWVFDLSAKFGEYYTGKSLTLETGIKLKIGSKIHLELLREGNYVRLKEGDFDVQVIRMKFDIYFSPKLYFQNYVQYDDLSKSIGINSRLRWIIKEGNDLFLVFNQGWGDILDKCYVVYRKVQVKLQYTFRF